MRIESGEKTQQKRKSIYEGEKLSESCAKRRKREERLEKEINNKTEAQVWKLVNKERKKKQ